MNLNYNIINPMKKQYLFLSLLTSFNLYAQEGNILSMALEELSQVETMDNSATLTVTEKKNIPLSVTVITQKDIQESGARNLDELLEIYVSDVAYMYKVQGSQLGIGGIISDRNNKILLTLNGRNLNIKASDGGAVTERWFSMLGDIKKITVISGPGSTIYGPGAIAGIINIETYDANSFEGFETNIKGGYVEEFSMLDLKYGTKLDNGVGVFLYAGVDDYKGQESDEAKNKVAFDFTPTASYLPQVLVANEPVPFETVNVNGSYQDEIRKKFHLQINYENFLFWSRYTKSGMAIPTSQNLYTNTNPKYLHDTGTSNEQWSSLLSYRQVLDYDFHIVYNLSYVQSKVELTNSTYPGNAGNKKWTEDNFDLHILSTYTPNERTKCALGAEYTYNRFGDSSSNIITSLPTGTKWHSNMYSLFGELQTKPTENSTVFLDLRIDKHSYSTMMFSPRIALAYNMDDTTSLKFNYSHSVRVPDDADTYYNYTYNNNTISDFEEIDHFELLYSYSLDNIKLDLKSSYNQQSVVAYSNAIVPGVTENIGDVDFYTLEAIFQYSYSDYTFYLSHNYTKQLNFTLQNSGTTRQNVSASEYGYGNDLANWNNNITKLRFNYDYSQNLKFINSLQIFWGIPGSVDMADYNRATFSGDGAAYYRLPVYTDGKRAFGESAYLNTAIEYKLNKQSKISLHGYNLLGYIDEDLNKRNYFNQTSHYIDVAPSFSLFLNYKLD